jgi:transcriptional regulator with XRE-family HTH domain
MYQSTLSTVSPLRMARLSLGLPQFVVAKRARIAASRLSVLERGYDEPNRCERANLAAALNTAEEQLFPVLPMPASASAATAPTNSIADA